MKRLTKVLFLLFQLAFPQLVPQALQSPVKPELVVQTTHTGPIHSVSFNPSGTILGSGGADGLIKLWDTRSRRLIRTLSGHDGAVNSITFNPTENVIASGSDDQTIKLWNITNGEVRTLSKNPSKIAALAFSADGQTLASGNDKGEIKLWEVKDAREIRILTGHSSSISCLAFSSDGGILASGAGGVQMDPKDNWMTGKKTFFDTVVKVWDVKAGKEIQTFQHGSRVLSVRIGFDKKIVTSANVDNVVKRWNIVTGAEISSVHGASSHAFSGTLSPDGELFASSTLDGTIEWFEASSGKLIQKRTLLGSTPAYAIAFNANGKVIVSADLLSTVTFWLVPTGDSLVLALKRVVFVSNVRFSPDGNTLATVGGERITLWNLRSGTARIINIEKGAQGVTFSPDGRKLASFDGLGQSIDLWDVDTGAPLNSLKHGSLWWRAVGFSSDSTEIVAMDDKHTVMIWQIKTGALLRTLSGDDPETEKTAKRISPDFDPKRPINMDYSERLAVITKGGDFLLAPTRTTLFDRSTGEELCSLVSIDYGGWVVVTPDGRFDTNADLTDLRVLHWIIADAPLTALPLEIFMRDYYEPNLLSRILTCNRLKICEKEFRDIRDISRLNRTQPTVEIAGIKLSSIPNAVDVSVNVQSVVSSFQKNYWGILLVSGAYDLRLFRDGQLVGVSTPSKDFAAFIRNEEKRRNQEFGSSLQTSEDLDWRAATDVFKLESPNVERISPNLVRYTFRNIKLPQDQRKEVAFTAYAFNSDRVKSMTTPPSKFALPASSSTQKKGRAYLIAIGVNASMRPVFRLRYAAKEARNMQRILGAHLESSAKYSEVVRISLISEYGEGRGKTLAENNAQKAIIKGVFSLLAGNGSEVSAQTLQQIPNREKIKPVEPEDTLIITYAGHGYTDRAGIFYFVPYDIDDRGTTAAIKNTISTDELSLWMQDITADEMIMIIDACHSEAAIVGGFFKPGPMGSRGLGQLAYDKGMKILSSTQSLALESNIFGQGLLAHALLQEGITAHADANRDGKLTANEWLSFAERRVPQLNKIIEPKPSSGFQQPNLFDFKRRNPSTTLFVLPSRALPNPQRVPTRLRSSGFDSHWP